MSLTSSAELIREMQKLHRGAIIELYTLDLTPLGVDSVLHFVNGADKNSQPVGFRGVSYVPLPIAVKGFEISGSAEPPRPSMSISNIGGFMTALVLQTDDLVGATLTRRRTFAKYLDGQPEAGDFELPEDVYYIEQKTNEHELSIEFELGSGLDLDGTFIPKRQVTAQYCRVDHYRGDGCYFAQNYCVQDKNGVTFSGADKYVGEFDPTFAYNVGDSMGYTLSGYWCLFVNVTACIGDANSPLLAPGKWTQVQRYRGAYDATLTYSTNDVVHVQYDDYKVYSIAKQSVPVNQRPPNAIYWTSDQCVKMLTSGCALHFDPRKRGLALNFNGFPGTQNLPEV